MSNPWHPPDSRIRRAIKQLNAPMKNRAKGKKGKCRAVRFVYALLRCQAHRVTRCTGVRFNVDHVLPLDAGGYHTASNLQVIPRSLNDAKGNNPHYVLPEPYRNPSPLPGTSIDD